MDTGYSLFPNIYFGKEHIGGHDDLKFCFSISKMKNEKLVDNGISSSNSNKEWGDQNNKLSE